MTLTGGYDLIPFTDGITGKTDKPVRSGADTGDPAQFATWEQFWEAYAAQTRHIIQRIVELYEQSESIRAKYAPTPYVSCLVKGCAEKGLDINEGGAQLGYVTIEAVTYRHHRRTRCWRSSISSMTKFCTMTELVQALRDNWVGHEVLQARALHKAPKYGRDDDAADALARQVMELWTDETWKYEPGPRAGGTAPACCPGTTGWRIRSSCQPARTGVRAASSCPTHCALRTARTSTARPPTSTRWARCWAVRARGR